MIVIMYKKYKKKFNIMLNIFQLITQPLLHMCNGVEKGKRNKIIGINFPGQQTTSGSSKD